MKKKVARKKSVKMLPAPGGSDTLPVGKIKIEPQAMIMAAVQGNASIDVLERLLKMHERINEKEAESEYREAMAKFQAECPIIVKGTSVLNKGGESVRYKYAQIDAIVKEVKPYLLSNGFSYQIKSEIIDKPFEGVKATAIAHHIGGHSEESSFSSPIDKSMAEKGYQTLQQAWLSAQSFSRRVAFCNLFGIMTGESDHDGNKPKSADSQKQEPSKDTKDKLAALPEYIASGFKALGYTVKNVIDFCNRFQWDHNKIKYELDKIANASDTEKIKNV
jgi:hypothetical protein